jgi:hypothetical protein
LSDYSILCIFLALSGHSVAKRLHTEAPTILKISEFFPSFSIIADL